MPARFKDLCLDAGDHQALADWWCAALSYVRWVGEGPRPLDWPVPIEDPAAPGAATSVALIARPDTGAGTGIRFLVPDAETEHAAMRQRGIEAGDLLRWPGVPPMFEFKDPDGNRFEIVEASA